MPHFGPLEVFGMGGLAIFLVATGVLCPGFDVVLSYELMRKLCSRF